MKPTEEQVKIFWEGCGFRRYEDKDGHWKGCFYWHNPPNTAEWGATWLPEIDLNNLFKYAVPNLTRLLGAKGAYDLLALWVRDIISGDDPALALFWAIDKVREGK